MGRLEWSALRSRLARRLAMSFIVCAAVPFVAAASIAFYEIRTLSGQQSADRLREFASAYGMTVIGRLVSAEGLLRTLSSRAVVSDEAAQAHAASLEEFRRVHYVAANATAPTASQATPALPWPTVEQQRALALEQSVVLSDRDRNARVRVFLVRQARRADAWVYAELDDVHLWGARDEWAAGLDAIVIGAAGELMYASRSLSESLLDQISRAASAPHADAGSPEVFRTDTGDSWQAHRWQVFLEGAFASPSWQVIAVAQRVPAFEELGPLRLLFPGFLAATLLSALWLSVWKIRRYLEPLERLIAGTRRVTQRKFEPVTVTSDDELGELARSFNHMTSHLREQFTALETLSQVDRLLLRSPGLEQVLDALLPRMAAVLASPTLSVLLFDADAPGYGRAYDFIGEANGSLPVRRIAVDPRKVESLFEQSGASQVIVESGHIHDLDLIAPRTDLAPGAISLWPLRHGQRLAGLLCLALAGDQRSDDVRVGRARDFADRLSVVLANVEHDRALYRQAHYDALTHLPNRALFGIRLENELAGVSGGARGALLYIDLDDFKRVNDTAGHGAGDELLKVIGQRILDCVKEADTVARLGGDEFAVVLRNLASPLRAREVADRILSSVAQPIQVGGRDHYVTASIGVTLFPGDSRSVAELLKNSDIAMYRAKEAGRGRATFFEPAMNERMLARASLETALHHAFRESQFELHYQPIVDADTRLISGAEALLRWPSAPAGCASPATFIPAAEDSGLIVEIGDWIIDTACRHFAAWQKHGCGVDYVSVNVSPRQLRESRFPDRVRATLERHGVPPSALQLEITENVLADAELAAKVLVSLSELRVRIALDDFGTGYSSLNYLRRYPIDVVKIDRSFIQDVAQSEAARTLVQTIIVMAHTLRKTVVAEGVETAEQLDFLQSRGCDAVQGYLLYRPMKVEQFEALGRRATELVTDARGETARVCARGR